jgi:hypothetical protein
MIAFWVRALLSGLIIATVSMIARRSPAFGALIASLPLISVVGMMWLWHDTHDAGNMARHAEATFFYVIPSLPMFLLIPWMLRRGTDFWPALAAGCALTMLLYFIAMAIASRFGVRI